MAYNPINAYEQGSRGGMYSVQSGDTLAGIASALWGDASLWYKIAEANGLAADSPLLEGMSLIIPAGVQSNANNATTFKPYDPLEVLGATSPTSPAPKKNKCGVLGQVVLVVIAFFVVKYLGPKVAAFFARVFGATAEQAAAAAAAVKGGAAGAAAAPTVAASAAAQAGVVAGSAVAGAAGSIVSQSVGVATGIQEKFSWNAVALTAIAAGNGALGPRPQTWWQAAAKAVSDSVRTQLLGVALGLQKEFSWAGVAAAGVGAGAGFALGDRFGANLGAALGDDLAGGVLSAGAALANAATRTLIEGSDFGDNVLAALPDVIGQTIGEAIAGGIADGARAADAERRLLAALEALEPQGDGSAYLNTEQYQEIDRALRRTRGGERDQLLRRILRVTGRAGVGLTLLTLSGDTPRPPPQTVDLEANGNFRLRWAEAEHWVVEVRRGDEYAAVGAATEISGENSQRLFAIDNVNAIEAYTEQDLGSAYDLILVPSEISSSHPTRTGIAIRVDTNSQRAIVDRGIALGWDAPRIRSAVAGGWRFSQDPDSPAPLSGPIIDPNANNPLNGVEIRSREENDLARDMAARGYDSSAIQNALHSMRGGGRPEWLQRLQDGITIRS